MNSSFLLKRGAVSVFRNEMCIYFFYETFFFIEEKKTKTR